jgi:hypothetical protein
MHVRDSLGELLTKDYVWHRRGEKVLGIARASDRDKGEKIKGTP